jgi:hypothetical protein
VLIPLSTLAFVMDRFPPPRTSGLPKHAPSLSPILANLFRTVFDATSDAAVFLVKTRRRDQREEATKTRNVLIEIRTASASSWVHKARMERNVNDQKEDACGSA